MAPQLVLNARQMLAIEIAERVASVLSVLGSLFIISTFLSFSFFRKPINRLVFFAAWGNIMANVATLMSTSAMPDDPNQLTPLCEFQGVMIQWFMMADSFWVFCMALNVLLVFFHGYDSQQLHHLEKWYFLFSYGVPAIPAITYIILDHHGPQRMIGPATIWCWVAKEVEWARIAFFYAPVWVCVSATMSIYFATGIKIFKQRSLMRSFSSPKRISALRDSGTIRKSDPDPFKVDNSIVVTTQIKYDVQPQEINSRSETPEGVYETPSSYSSTRNLSGPSCAEDLNPVQTSPTRQNWQNGLPVDVRRNSQRLSRYENNGYTATAFATLPSGDMATFPIRTPPSSPRPRKTQTRPPTRTVIRPAEGNAAAYAYLKVAFLMFVALFVVWVPSTGNRLYQYIHQDRANYGLNFASALVLPLQGFWNVVIYMSTTWPECKRAYGLIVARLTGGVPRYQPQQDIHPNDNTPSTRGTRDSEADFPLEEIIEYGGTARHSSISNTDTIVEDGLYHAKDSR